MHYFLLAAAHAIFAILFSTTGDSEMAFAQAMGALVISALGIVRIAIDS